jgi:hypothetical protein
MVALFGLRVEILILQHMQSFSWAIREQEFEHIFFPDVSHSHFATHIVIYYSNRFFFRELKSRAEQCRARDAGWFM